MAKGKPVRFFSRLVGTKRLLAIALLVLTTVLIVLGGINALVGAILDDYRQQAESAASFAGLSTAYSITRRFATENLVYPFLSRPDNTVDLAIWSRGLTGEAQLSILDDGGSVIYEQSGRNLSVEEQLRLDSGAYTLILDFSHFTGEFRFGFSNLQFVTPLPDSRYHYIAANPAAGYSWDYIVYVPETVTAPYLLVIPNNTGFEDSNYAIHQESAKDLTRWMSSMADELGTPLLVPVFPRPAGDLAEYYTHNLDRDVLLMTQPGYERLDLQLLAMVDDARASLAADGILIGPRFLMWGFSASATLADRFTLLHPDHLRAVAAASANSLPLAEYAGENLPYPVGIYDYEAIVGHAFDYEQYTALPRFLFRGNQDNGGWITTQTGTFPANEYFERFVRSDLEASLDTFPVPAVTGFGMTETEEMVIKYRVFHGAVFVDEFLAVRDIYAGLGLGRCQFRLYPGVGHRFTDEMRADVISFFRSVIH